MEIPEEEEEALAEEEGVVAGVQVEDVAGVEVEVDIRREAKIGDVEVVGFRILLIEWSAGSVRGARKILRSLQDPAPWTRLATRLK